MDVKNFPRLCYPVHVAALKRADPPSKESYQLFVRFIVFRLILKWDHARGSYQSKEDEEKEGTL
jgi:hypothetical protein